MSIYSKVFICLSILFCCAIDHKAQAQTVYEDSDSLIFEKYIADFSKYGGLSDNELLLKTAKYFIGSPYVASTLDANNEEKLTVNLREFDCTTLVESSLALIKTIKSNNHSFSEFCDQLKNIRYRTGKIEDYSSRLHYTSDWIRENERKGLLTNISISLEGQLVNKPINFMTNHISAYKQLLNNKDLQEKIKKVEEQLNNKGGYYVISKEKLCKVNKSMKNGDIVAFSTSVQGLDFSHIGIIALEGNTVTFVHASSTQKKVVLESKSLVEYCQSSKKCNGVTILRLN